MSPSKRPACVQRFVESAYAAARTWFDADGNWITREAPPFWGRDRIWLCASLYDIDPKFCDPVVYQHGTGSAGRHRYNVFTSDLAICLLAQHR